MWKNIKLNPIKNVVMSKFEGFPDIEFKSHKDMYLICQLSGSINNENYDSIGNKFQLALIPESQHSIDNKGEIWSSAESRHSIDNKSEIWNSIDQKLVQFSKTQIVKLKANENKLELHGKVSDSSVKLQKSEEGVIRTTEILFEQLEVRCFKMEGYLKIPEYEKGGIED